MVRICTIIGKCIEFCCIIRFRKFNRHGERAACPLSPQYRKNNKMLELRQITKEYKTGGEVVKALKGIDLAFRRSEFVSILGPSGCGKTTMLNIMGGLDQYTDGDLVIDGISTKEYRDADWDAYRNDTIGFVFQSYNLISHQTVLANVELALTLSGVSASERRQRAISALEQVGLGDQINKRPAQMSGGQVQRVAIARALINDPDIILADEPTGALDSETSLQVMGILKGISQSKLVIMVTHNPELAEQYSTRIVRLSDGNVISDSDPYVPGTEPELLTETDLVAPAAASAAASSAEMPDGSAPAAQAAAAQTAEKASVATAQTADVNISAPERKSRRARRRRNRSMSMATALHLSLNNLMTKKARTLLTAFAGSIGIIGIALILSVSSGFQAYIDKLEEDTLSSYPLTIQSETADMTSMITAFAANAQDTKGEEADGSVHEQQVMTDLLASVGSNDLASFKDHVDGSMNRIGDWFNAYEYSYGISPNIYSVDMKYGVLRVSPGSIMQSYMSGFQANNLSMANNDVFFRMMDNQKLLQSQFKVLAGKWPEKYNELLLVLDSEDQLNDYIVYTIGLRDPKELKDMINDVMNGKEVENNNKQLEWTYDDFIGMEFALVNACDTFKRNSSYDVWEDMTEDKAYMKKLIKDAERLKITGVVCARDRSGANAMDSGIGYLPSLTQHLIDYSKDSEIVRLQLAKKKTDVFSGKTFEDIRNDTDEGLGFEDMISIDKGKLAKAMGGSFNEKALNNAIIKIGNDALSKITDEKAISKIENAVTKDLRNGCKGINSDLVDECEKDADGFKLDDSIIDKALGENLYSGKRAHGPMTNELLKGYDAALKAAAPEINKGMAAADPDAVAAQVAEQLSKSGMDITASQVKKLLGSIPADAGDDQVSQIISAAIPGLPEEALSSLVPVFRQAAAAMQKDPSEILSSALSAVEKGFINADELKKGINKYAVQIVAASNLYPALGKVAQAVGSQFNVDPEGIAEAFTMKMDEDELTRLITAYVSGDEESNLDSNLRKLGYADVKKPTSMSFYLRDFESKEKFLDFIEDYNKKMQDNGDEDMVISYTDITGVLIKSVKTITNAVSYVLIAFVAISLIVSSIMIGVITYISVLERTKEIGILRAIGASKRDISRIFNAETVIVGLIAGLIGIGASLLLLIPINKILLDLTKIAALKAVLPAVGGVALILISIFLTFIAGLIPSGMAARKDPVEALRTE